MAHNGRRTDLAWINSRCAVPETIRTVVITGAGGYLGSALCRFFHGMPPFRVIAVFRGKPSHEHYSSHLSADVFTQDWAAQVAAEPVLLINCAFEFAAVGKAEPAERYAVLARNLALLAGDPQTRLINVSTMSAYPGCRTDYGREKIFIEELFRERGGTSIRPGLIVSWRRPGTAFLNLIETVRRMTFVPLLTARRSGFYIADLDAVILGIYLLTQLRLSKPHTLSFCYRERLRLRELLRRIEGRLGLSRVHIPLPWPIAYLLLLGKERLTGVAKVRADSVLDFAYPAQSAPRRGFFARLVREHGAELDAGAAGRPPQDSFRELECGPARAPRQSAVVAGHIDTAIARLRELDA
jgi:nucleoside-diphosphate-sugar epimerase